MGANPEPGDEKAFSTEGCEHRSAKRRAADFDELRPSHGCSFRHYSAAYRPIALWSLRASTGFHNLHFAEPVSRRVGGGAAVYARPIGNELDLRSPIRWKRRPSGRLCKNDKTDFSSLG